MADDNITLLKALQGATYSPTESMYGIGAQTIASGIPLLTNPYDSPSQNFGTTVGAGLLAGLLGGYAKVDAAQENAQIMPLMGQIMQADPAERMAIAAGNPRLSPLVQALAYDDYSRKTKMDDAVKTKVAEFKALSPLEQQQLIDQKIIDTGFDQGQVPTDKGLIPVSDLGLKSPQELEIQQKKDLIFAEDDARKQLLKGTNIPDEVANLPEDLQKPAIEELAAKAKEGKKLEFVIDQFEKAKNISSIAASIPGGYTASSKELEGIKSGLKESWQQITGKEKSGPALKDFESMLPEASDSKAMIELKKERFLKMVIAEAGGAIMAPPQANYIKAPDGRLIEIVD